MCVCVELYCMYLHLFMLMAMSISNFPWKGITKVNLILFYPMKIQNIMELLNFMQEHQGIMIWLVLHSGAQVSNSTFCSKACK